MTVWLYAGVEDDLTYGTKNIGNSTKNIYITAITVCKKQTVSCCSICIITGYLELLSVDY